MYFPDAAKYTDGKHMYLLFLFSRVRLSARVQGADTVSFQATASHSDRATNRRPLCLAYFVFHWEEGQTSFGLRREKNTLEDKKQEEIFVRWWKI